MRRHEPFMGKPVSHGEADRCLDKPPRMSFWTMVWYALLDVAACLGYIFK